MIKKIFLNIWIVRLYILLVIVVKFCTNAIGQTNYWSLFGTNGCNTSNRMLCGVTPSSGSFSGISDLNDVSSSADARPNNFKNSCYDGRGNLLFSVNHDGIYDPSGTQVMDFTPDPAFGTFTGTSSAGSWTAAPGFAVSEIVIFPKTGTSNIYYVMFWDKDYYNNHQYEIRAITVTVTSSGVICTDGVMIDNTTGPYQIGPYGSPDENPFRYCIAVDALNCSNNTRDIYTLDPQYDATGTSDFTGLSKMRRWTMSSNGTLPSTSYTYSDHRTTDLYQRNATSSKAKIFNIGGVKYFAYISGASGSELVGGAYPPVGYMLALYTLTDATSIYASTGTFYPQVTDTWHDQIYGFEYLPSKNVIYFSHTSWSSGAITGGGLGYWDASGGVHYSGNDTHDYENTDLEYNANGDLLMVQGTDPTTDGKLAYIPASTSISTTISPTLCTTSCTGSYTNVSVQNNIFSGVFIGYYNDCYYLTSQIRGENYNQWGGLPYTVHTGTTETWTSTNNPVTNISGITASVIYMNDIIIEYGASLTINGMTVTMASGSHIHVNRASSRSSTGGRLILNNSVLTRGSCDGGAGMWGGIQVDGDAAFSQYPTGSSPQGWVDMKNNSAVCFATIGVDMPGGGFVTAANTTFINNTTSVSFGTYRNFDAGTGLEIRNISAFTQCTFQSTDISTTRGGALTHVFGTGVNNVKFKGCDFLNSCGASPSVGIEANDMGFAVTEYVAGGVHYPSSFSLFTYGIDHHGGPHASYAAVVSNSQFTYNGIGIRLTGSISPFVAGNTFLVRAGFPGGMSWGYFSPIDAMGIMLNGATMYSVYSNKFQYVAPRRLPATPGGNNTVGVLAYATGGDDNLINNNVYNGLGTANLSNFQNHYGSNRGLMFRCNTQTNNVFDIAARGLNNDPTYGDGIRYVQGVAPSTGFASLPPIINGLPAGNTFSYMPTGLTTYIAYNLYSPYLETYPFLYFYCTASGTNPLEVPGVPGTTGMVLSATPIPHPITIATDNCDISSGTHAGSGNSAGAGSVIGAGVITPSFNNQINAYLSILNNLSYYMADSAGVMHRDSVFYSLRQLNTYSSALARAKMFLQDGNTDSAYNIYNSITSNYNLAGPVATEFNTWGKRLFDVQSRIALYNFARKGMISAAYSSYNSDSVFADSAFNAVINAPYTLTTGALDTLVRIFDSSQSWGHLGAESILNTYAHDTLISMLTAMPDTMLYPVLPDSLQNLPSPPGVLALTEISHGPATDAAGSCAYAEMIVSSCGTGSPTYVDVSGWIIDDNSGNFTASCTDTATTRGHYRLAYNSIWQKTKIGSVIVVYNAANNCYNLPDTFTVDSANAIYWVPVYDTALPDSSYVLQRYDGGENADAGTYCSDTGASVYTNAYGWQQTNALNPVADAIQVRCPGCTVTAPSAPLFYHGIGYAPDSSYCFNGISAGANSLGATLEYHHGSTHKKYMFTGRTAADFGSHNKWVAVDADTAGAPPPSLGYVDSALSDSVLSYTLALPCCGSNVSERNAHNTQPGPGVAQSVAAIKVYPNPAKMQLHFEFPKGDVTVKVMDITGRLMEQQTVYNNGSTTINVKDYTPGIYLYQVITNGKTQSGKILVDR